MADFPFCHLLLSAKLPGGCSTSNALDAPEIGLSSEPARDALKNALTDVDTKVRQNAVRALARLGDFSALNALKRDRSRAVRRTVREVLK